jgi:hypothetical protein
LFAIALLLEASRPVWVTWARPGVPSGTPNAALKSPLPSDSKATKLDALPGSGKKTSWITLGRDAPGAVLMNLRRRRQFEKAAPPRLIQKAALIAHMAKSAMYAPPTKGPYASGTTRGEVILLWHRSSPLPLQTSPCRLAKGGAALETALI